MTTCVLDWNFKLKIEQTYSMSLAQRVDVKLLVVVVVLESKVHWAQ
jgi:hypothetical protein